MIPLETVEAIWEARSKLESGSSREEVGRLTVESVAELLECDLCRIVVEREGTFSVEASAERTDESSNGSLIGQAALALTFRENEPLLIRDAADDDRVSRAGEYGSLLTVPLGEGSVLQLGAREPGSFDEDELALADLFGAVAGRALDRVSDRSGRSRSGESERTFSPFLEAARDLSTADSESEIAQIVVEAATERLDLPLASVNRFDEADGELHPVWYAPDVEDVIGSPPSLPLDDSVAGRAYVESETTVVDDVRRDEAVYNPDTAVRSQLVVPIEEFGVFICGHTEPGFFDRSDLELAELLVSVSEGALHRVARARQLGHRERAFEQQTRQLEHLETLNVLIRAVSQLVVRAETRGEIEQTVCEKLVRSDQFTFAWIGDVDPPNDRLVVRTRAGSDLGYLESVPRSLEGATEPAVLTAETKEPTVVPNTATDVQTDPWRREALRRGFGSIMAVPLLYRDILFGVLTVYAAEQNAFDGMTRNVLTELGELVGYTVSAVGRKHALLSDRMTELDFTITDLRCLFVRFAQQTGCSIAFDEVVSDEEGSVTVFVKVTEGSVDDFLEYVRDAPEVVRVRLFDETDTGPVLQIRVTGRFIASLLADHGIPVRSITAEGDAARVTVGLPPTMTAHRVLEVISTEFPDSEFVARRESTGPSDLAILPERILEELTDRQRDAARIAYEEGYFDSPKRITGAEAAEALGLSSTAFNEHLRAAQRTIFRLLFDEHTT